ncbi:protein kinase [Myxococcota bacterium]|nr:protein kinase [Myxococcota bacterium]MBU1383169.1 protein kinase [Myxococcota bacterium]MBU1497195.1 protein kinase [Myxococcota bacterium]
MKVCPACNATYEDDKVFCPKDGGKLVEAGSSASNSRIGQVLDGRYRLVRMLGEGGMGEVYEAAHVYIDKKVAIKLLRPEITSSSEAVKRFYQEARSASSIGHENIIEIEDFGKLDDGTIYLAMEYLQGSALADLMLNGAMEPGRALDFMKQICEGLHAAHEKSIVHRDMKPENVFIIRDRKGRELVKILDFGIAKMTSTDGEGKGLTKTGTIFGTPHYMAPEQAMGNALDHRADVYSIGVIMFELFTGSVPFKAESFMGILTQHITTPPPRPTTLNANLHPRIEQSILRAMGKDPNERYQTMAEFLQDLNNIGVELGISEPVPVPVTAPVGSAPMQPTGYAPHPTGYAPPPVGYAPQSTGMMTPPPQGTGNFAPMPNNTGNYAPQGNTGNFPPQPGNTGNFAPQGTGNFQAPANTGNYTPPGSGGYAPPPAAASTGFQTQTPFAGQSTHAKKRKKGNGLAIGIVIIILLGAAGGGGYWWFFLRDSGDKKSDDKTQVASDDVNKKGWEKGDMKPEDTKPEDMKPEDMKPEDMKPEDMKATEPDKKPEDMKPEDMKPEEGPKFKNPVKITILTNVDSDPPPTIKIGDKTYTSPYVLTMENNGEEEIEVSKPGYKTVTKKIKGSGRSRVRIKLKYIKTKDPKVDMKPVMDPVMVKPPMPPMPPVMTGVTFD